MHYEKGYELEPFVVEVLQLIFTELSLFVKVSQHGVQGEQSNNSRCIQKVFLGLCGSKSASKYLKTAAEHIHITLNKFHVILSHPVCSMANLVLKNDYFRLLLRQWF